MVDELLASPFELPSRMAGFRGGAKESGKGRMRTPKHLSDEASLAYDDDDALGRGNISPLSSPMSTRRCQSIVDPLESFETSSVTGPCGSAVASGRNGRMRYLADEDRLEDDDDDAAGDDGASRNNENGDVHHNGAPPFAILSARPLSSDRSRA